MKFFGKLSAALATCAVLGATAAQANINLSLVGGAPLAIGGTPSVFRYQYAVTLSGTSAPSVINFSLASGSNITIFDFFQLTGSPTFSTTASGAAGVGVATPSDFTVTTPLTGVRTPVVGTDSPVVANVNYAYSGATITTVNGADVLLGYAIIDSTAFGTASATPYAANDTNATIGQASGNGTFIPGPNQIVVNSPEPGSIALLGVGLAGMTGMVLRRRKSA